MSWTLGGPSTGTAGVTRQVICQEVDHSEDAGIQPPLREALSQAEKKNSGTKCGDGIAQPPDLPLLLEFQVSFRPLLRLKTSFFA